MPDPTLIIPGTQATTLKDGDGKVVYNAVRVGIPLLRDSLGGHPKTQWVALMSMRHLPGRLEPVKTSLLPGTTLTPGFVVQTPYALFPKYYEEWPYDWRADLRWNAQRLLADLRARHARGDARANLVGHSQGGLLIVLASKLANAGEFAALAARVALIGSPLAGTMVAVEALLTGSSGLGKKERGLARTMARTWPALYQMLASWPCVCREDGSAYPAGSQLLQPTGWPAADASGIDPDLLLRARDTQAMLTDPLANFGPGIAVRTFMGLSEDTGTRLTRTGDAFGKIVADKTAGDDLVHFQRTLDWGGKPFGYTCYPFGGATRLHGELCCDYTVAASVIHFLNEPAPLPPA